MVENVTCHEELEALEENLGDDKLFFDPNHPNKPSQQDANMGSMRRLQQVERRRSCNTQTQLWKRASLKVITNNQLASPAPRFSSLLPDSRQPFEGAIVPAIQEDASVSSSSRESAEVEDSVKKGEEKKVEDSEEVEEYLSSIHHQLLTCRASQNIYNGEGFEIGEEDLFSMYAQLYDPWEDKDAALAFDFHIIGTSADDSDAHPHVLSPPMMHSLQSSLPISKQGESFWLKYSLVRDGASTTAFLQNLRGSTHTLMAMETVDGEVFGAFSAAPWTIQHDYFGTSESFLWRLKHSRNETAREEDDFLSLVEQAKRETDIDVFRYAYENRVSQICHHDRIAVGGELPLAPRRVATGETLDPQDFGFGISFEGDYLVEATSSACLTFNSPSLSKRHSDGSRFELINLEVWALTPCITLAEAQRMEYQKLFLKRNRMTQRVNV
jgi:hypothetical protein